MGCDFLTTDSVLHGALSVFNTQAVSGGSLVFSPITSAIRARLHIPCDLIGETTIRLVPTWCGAFYLEDYNDSGVL